MKPFISFILVAAFAFSCKNSGGSISLGLMQDPDLTSLSDIKLDKIKLPEGFKIDIYGRVDNARSLALSPEGTLYIGNRSGDKVYALRDIDGDMKADEKYVIAKGLKMPNGVAFKDGSLYVAEVDKLWRYDNIEQNLNSPAEPVKIYDDYPTDGHHGWKYIAFGPDGRLYIPVGAPCNLCESKDERYASITRMDPEGGNREVYAKGVRNTVGFTWHPDTKEMWFTDNGRDWFGDDKPNCELNRIPTDWDWPKAERPHYGYPYCHAGEYIDDEFGDGKDCDDYISPAQKLGPHVAPLGIKFGVTTNFPEGYKNKLFIAEHGSWNSDKKVGYRISLVTEVNGTGTNYESFATGWLNEDKQEAWGRPVDLIFAKDGSILLSDDLSGTIYRIWYDG